MTNRGQSTNQPDTDESETEHDLEDARSIIAEAKWTLESAARWEENPENARSYKFHAEQLDIAMDVVSDEVQES